MTLEKGVNNTNIALTLYEKTTLSTPYYLFEFENNYTKVKYYQVFTDVSVAGAARERANLFNIELVSSGAGANQIVLGNIGLYNLVVYEQTSAVNLDPALATGIVQRTPVRVIGTEASIYVSHDTVITYVAHEQ
jgi:hypothetical protein